MPAARIRRRKRRSSPLGSGPRGTPTIAGKSLYAIGINGVISAFDVETGKRRWQVNLYEHFKAELPRFGVCSSPLVVGNRVVVSVGGKGRCVVALNTESGAVEWQAFDDAASTSSAVLFSAGQRATGVPPDVVFITPLRLLGLDPLDGSLRWENPMVFQPQGTSPTPIALGDMLVASTQAHGAVAVKVKTTDSGYAADAGWQRAEAKSYFSSGVAGPDLLFLLTNVVEMLPVANLTCLDAKTGKELWVKEKIGYFHAALTKLGDGKLLVLSDAGTRSLLEVNAEGVLPRRRRAGLPGIAAAKVTRSVSEGHSRCARTYSAPVCWQPRPWRHAPSRPAPQRWPRGSMPA